jgi:ABC-type transport system involved in multi-copper enzyme maturation permease subunit
MINVIARHKLSKLRNSKMLLIFFIVTGFIAAITIFPMIIFSATMGVKLSGAEALASYFKLISMIGHAAALMIGATCWRQDLRDGTILTFAARPLSRLSLFYGKVVGCFYAAILYIAVALVLFALIDLFFFSYLPPMGFYLYLLQQFLSLILTFAVVLFLTNFFNPVMAVVIAVLYFFIGSIGSALALFTSGVWHALGIAIRAIAIERDLSYSPTAVLIADVESLKPVWNAVGYYLLWIVMLTSASALLFVRRELLTKRS